MVRPTRAINQRIMPWQNCNLERIIFAEVRERATLSAVCECLVSDSPARKVENRRWGIRSRRERGRGLSRSLLPPPPPFHAIWGKFGRKRDILILLHTISFLLNSHLNEPSRQRWRNINCCWQGGYRSCRIWIEWAANSGNYTQEHPLDSLADNGLW